VVLKVAYDFSCPVLVAYKKILHFILHVFFFSFFLFFFLFLLINYVSLFQDEAKYEKCEDKDKEVFEELLTPNDTTKFGNFNLFF